MNSSKTSMLIFKVTRCTPGRHMLQPSGMPQGPMLLWVNLAVFENTHKVIRLLRVRSSKLQVNQNLIIALVFQEPYHTVQVQRYACFWQDIINSKIRVFSNNSFSTMPHKISLHKIKKTNEFDRTWDTCFHTVHQNLQKSTNVANATNIPNSDGKNSFAFCRSDIKSLQ